MIKKSILLILFSFTLVFSYAQKDSIGFFIPAKEYNKKRVTGLSIGMGSLYAVSIVGLYSAWYKDHPITRFHFFNDNKEWQQIDKGGHIIASYYIGNYCVEMMKWTGMPRKKAIWIGGSMGSVFLTTIEILDGFSGQYGASWGDLLANTAGSAMVTAQALAWDEQRILLRYSFMNAPGWKYRHDLLGSNLAERLLKDYNSITYWLSFNIHSFLPETSRFPCWLNVAVGYGANGMLGGMSNPAKHSGVTLPDYERYRQYYFSLDVQLSKIKTKSKVLKTIFSAFDIVKFPFPALEYNRVHGFGVYPFNKH